MAVATRAVIGRRKRSAIVGERLAALVFLGATLIGLIALAALLYTVVKQGAGELDAPFPSCL